MNLFNELYVSVDQDAAVSRETIERIVGHESSGSGIGMGTRDFDFRVPHRLTQIDIDGLKEALEAALGVPVDVLFEVWKDVEDPDVLFEALYAARIPNASV